MKPRTIKYYIREAARSLIMNRLMTVASVFTVASCIFILSVFYILTANIEHMFERIEDGLGLVALIGDDVSAAELTPLRDLIAAIPNVSEVEYISREDGLVMVKQMFGENSSMVDVMLLGPNPVRRSFGVNLTDLQHHDDVFLALEALSHAGIESVVSERDVINVALALSSVVQFVSLFLIIMLAGVSIIIIINTIRITVNARQAEINIMKYVGATDWFIRWPFVIEGILIGLIGGIVPAGIAWFGYTPVLNVISGIPFLDFIDFLPAEAVFVYLFPFAIIIGGAIGFVGSMVSVRQHLMV